MNELKKNNLIKARKLSYIFRFIIDLNAINVGGEFERNNCNIYPKELELDKENTDTNEASFMDSDIKIKDGMFQVGLFNKRLLNGLYQDTHFLFLLSECQTSYVPSSSFFYSWC